MDMEYEMQQEGAAGEVVTPEEEDEKQTQAAEAEGEKESEDAKRSQGKAEQTHEERVRFSAARRQGERTGYERAAKETNARIAGAGLIDPITGKPIETLEDFEEYGKRYRQQRLEAKAKKENKTVDQVEEEETALEMLRKKRREDGEKEEQERKLQEHKEWLRKDFEDFSATFPDVDLTKLEQDKRFRKFCGERFGKEPAAILYADYLEVVESAQQSAAARRQEKQDRSTGTGGGGGGDVLTAAQRRELEAWNAAYPKLKMTEKEFLKFR